MTRRNGGCRVAAYLSPLLAATLACSLLPGASPSSSNAVLTQAAATITAAAVLIATNSAAAASVPSPTRAPAPTVAATVKSTATALPTEAASTSTLEPSVIGTPTLVPGGAVVLDPCSLVTSAEAASLIGVPVGTPKQQNGGCLFVDAATGFSSGLVVYALPPSQTQYFLQRYVSLLKASGVHVDSASTDKLNADIQAGDTVASVNDLAAMAVGQSSYKANKVDGLGSSALWSWQAAGKFQQGSLLTAQPGALVVLAVVVGASAKEADAQLALKPIASRILSGLPASFTVAGLQVAGSAPALDPCSLAGPGDAETILGAKATDGVAEQGECVFKDAATQQRLLRVFAFPAGVAATNALNSAASAVLIGNAKAQTQVTADLAAGDLVAVVRDLAASGQSGGGRTLESVDGLGDSAMFYAQALGSNRFGYVLAAKPDVLIGLYLQLKPGDDAATRKATVALLTRILSQLPPKFTVSGAP